MRATCNDRLTIFDFAIQIIIGKEYSAVQFSPPVPSTLCGHNILFSTQLSNTLSQRPSLTTQINTNSVAFGPQADYTDWATATCWWKLVPTFADRGVSRGQRGGSPMVVNLSFLDRSRYFSFEQLLIYPHKGWVDPVPDQLLLRKSGSVGYRTRDLGVCSQDVWPLDHRGGLQVPQPYKIKIQNSPTIIQWKRPHCSQG
jgi:hypothetical protein